MSIGLWNHDGTFFDVTSKDVKLENVANEDIISLDITEEMAKMDSGTISFFDPNHIYSRLFRPGAILSISWGIKPSVGLPVQRDKVDFMINSPSGGGDSSGRVVFNCSFMALGFRGDSSTRWYESGTKSDVISQVLTRLNVLPYNSEINFSRGKEKINGNKIAQYESDFRFLVRMADEWRCAFRIGKDKKGKTVACFIDYGNLATSVFAFRIGGAYSAHFEYGGVRTARPLLTGNANVLSYNWKDNSMDSSTGQGARIVMIDGQPQIFRTIVENETVKTYRLVPERIEQELARKDLLQRTDLLTEYLSAKNFKDVERFFVEETTTTAPQGSGITVDIDAMGDPTLTAGLVATFGSGFPDRVGAKDRTWWIRKTNHKISINGYFSSVEVADAYSFSPTGTKITPVGGTM